MIILKSCDILNNYPTIRAMGSALSQLLKFNDLKSINQDVSNMG